VNDEAPRSGRAGVAVLLGIVLVGAGVVLAFVFSNTGGGGGGHAQATGPGIGQLPTAPATVATTTAFVVLPPASSHGVWPKGTSAWTVVVAMLGKKGRSRAAMESTARRLSIPGAKVHVLDTSSHPDLRQNLWVLWSGRWSSRGQALPTVARLKAAGRKHAVAERLTG
jgi:hypothetical protein